MLHSYVLETILQYTYATYDNMNLYGIEFVRSHIIYCRLHNYSL